MNIDTSHPQLTSSDSNERREFKAGFGFYAFMIPFATLIALFAVFILCRRESKGLILFGVVQGYVAFISFHELLSWTPLWPWYRGPTLVVDDHGLKTDKWSIPWTEIEKVSLSSGNRSIRVGIVKKGQRSWESPYYVEGPLARMTDVVHYLQVRHSGLS